MNQMKQDVDNAKANASMAEAQRVMMAMNLSAANGEKEKLEGEVAVLDRVLEEVGDQEALGGGIGHVTALADTVER